MEESSRLYSVFDKRLKDLEWSVRKNCLMVQRLVYEAKSYIYCFKVMSQGHIILGGQFKEIIVLTPNEDGDGKYKV